MEDRVSKKRNQLDFYFSSFQDIFSVPYSNFKCNPYSNLRGSSEQKYYPEYLIEKKYSEKNMLSELHDTDFDVSLSSAESKNQLPSIKSKKVKKIIGLPYQKEIKKNEKLLKMKKVQTASNWFPGIASQNKQEEVRSSQPLVRPASSNATCHKNSIKAYPLIAQSNSELKIEPPNSTRPQSKHKRVVLKSKIKKISEEKLESPLECEKNLEGGLQIEEKVEKKRKKSIKKSFDRKFSIPVEENEELKGSEKVPKDEKIEKNEKKTKKDRKEKKERREKFERNDLKTATGDDHRFYERMKSKERKPERKEQNEEEKHLKVTKKPSAPTVSDVVGKHRSFNLNQLLNNKNTDFKGLMQEYLRRSGLAENTKIFIITGPYEYLRKILISRGWIENTHSSSQAFDLKWTFTDNESDYKTLRPGQFYNHFPNNRELTTKSGLHKNLRQVMDHATNIDSFYPRTFDLGDSTQVSEFIKDYQRTSAFNIIKRFLDGKKVTCEVLTLAVRVAKKQIKDIQDQCEVVENEWEFAEEVFKKILEFSENDRKDAENAEFDIINDELRNSAFEANKELSKHFPQHFMEGYRNIWIVKPGLNARGSGVKCMQGLENILECGVHLKARVVQKYIENPLLINQNKFDIRQWVLVTSFDPLTIYFYNSCYFRLCQMAFSLDSLEAYRHLANYSLQKNIAKVQEETVWNLDKFSEFLQSNGQSWDLILPKIHYLIIKTLLSVKDSIDSRPECFELYGFDIILDNEFCPWLLEVNLSPACSERTEWLSQMLFGMGNGILDIVFEDKKKKPIYSSDLKTLKKIKSNRNKWILLYKAEDSPCLDYENLPFAALEIVGEKLNVKREKIFDRKLALSNSALIIQKVFRGFLTRKKLRKQMENRVSIVIQNVFRRKRAFEIKEIQIRLVSCIKMQSFCRMVLAGKRLKELKKLKVIKYIQAHLKGLYQRNEFKKVRVKRSVLNIQKAFRCKLSQIRVKQLKRFHQAVLQIQTHWKKRWKLKNDSAFLIQKHWKKHFQLLNRYSSKIQRLFRTYKSKKHLKHLKYLKIKEKKLQSLLQVPISINRVSNQKILSSLLQINSRFTLHRVLSILSYILKQKSAILIQKHIRRYQAEQKYRPSIKNSIILHNSLIFIQKVLEGYQSRLTFVCKLKNHSATLIQKAFKGYKTRKFFHFLIIINESAKIIQRAYRKFRNKRKFQMMLRIRDQEIERKRRMERLKREQEIKALMASERLHTNSGTMRPPSLKAKQQMILESKLGVKRKSSKKKCKHSDTSVEEMKSLPRASTQEGKKLKKTSPKDFFGL